jgi:hypothetical protein
MHSAQFCSRLGICCTVLLVAFSQTATAKTLCVMPGASTACYSKIQSAVNAASPNDVIDVAPGVYKEEVIVGKPLSLIGSGRRGSVIDATGLAHGIFVDGYDNAGLRNVTVAGFTVQNALYEGILVVSAYDVVIRDNKILNNDTVPDAMFTGALTGCPKQPGSGTYETDETGDCGGALHLVGTVNALVSGNFMTGNADGILISDETGESRNNVIVRNVVKDNPKECGIVLASHPPAGKTSTLPPHNGVDHNTVAENLSTDNGVKVGGSGVGMFSDGAGRGRVSDNVIIRNTLTNNGLGGVALHTHVGPAFGLPADNMSGNKIIGNFIAGNLADQADTATPGSVGININSGDGGSPVYGTVIAENIIRDEEFDVAVNTPAEVDIHLNDLKGGKVGVADVCAFDGAKICTGSIDATENYWGCAGGPGAPGCSTTSGSDIRSTPWLKHSIGDEGRDNDR